MKTKLAGNILLTFLVAGFVLNLSFAFIQDTWTLNSMCNIHFDHKLYEADRVAIREQSIEKLDKCINSTNTKLIQEKKNLTDWDFKICRSKCIQIVHKHANPDGSLNSKVGDVMTAAYQKYTNASKSFAQKVANKYTACVREVNEEIEMMKANGTYIKECQNNWYYTLCTMDIMDYFKNSNATKEFCPQ